MKCKLRKIVMAYGGDEGLIEAYWNVNVFGMIERINLSAGLIEAYWNVNGDWCRFCRARQQWFNRSILKCKFLRRWHEAPRRWRFNRSILKCKWIRLGGTNGCHQGFNRSILKCKYRFFLARQSLACGV